MIRKVFVKITAVILLFSFLINLTGIRAYSAESDYYDGVWDIKSDYWTTFSIHIEGDQMEAFTLTYAGATYSFPSAKIEGNSLVTADGDNELHIFFNSSDNTAATGQLELWPKEDSDIGSFGRVNITAKNLYPKPSATPTPIPSNVTILDKTKWTNILPTKDQKLADSLACLNDAAWNGKNYVIVGRGKILSSTDGVSWKTAYSMKEDQSLFGVVWNGKEFTVIGNDESKNTAIVLKSTDAKEWKLIKTDINSFMLDIAWNNKRYAAVGRSATLITSSDGNKWTKADIPTDSDFNSIIWAGNRFVAVGDNVIAVSPDGSDWEVITDQKGYFTGIVYYKEQYCIFDLSGKVLTTKDFSKWDSEQIVLPESGSFITNSSCSKELIMVAMSDPDTILTTTDLKQWTMDPLQKEDYVAVNNVVYVNDRFYAVGPKYISLYQPETAEKITVIINGSSKKLSQSPYMSGNVMMLPVKAVLEAAGAKAEVSGKVVTITYGKKKAVLTLGSSRAALNKESVKLEAKVTSKNKVIYAPLEKIVEALGGTYKWDGKKKSVTINFK